MAWNLERSAEAVAQGIGCSEENDSERVPVSRSLQPTLDLGGIIPQGRFPTFSAAAAGPAVAATNAIVQLLATSECRVRRITVAIAAGNVVAFRLSDADQRTANQALGTKSDAYADQPSRSLIELGTAGAVPGVGPQFASSTEPVIEIPAALVVPQGMRLVFWSVTQNLEMTVSLLSEERDGRVRRVLSA